MFRLKYDVGHLLVYTLATFFQPADQT